METLKYVIYFFITTDDSPNPITVEYTLKLLHVMSNELLTDLKTLDSLTGYM